MNILVLLPLLSVLYLSSTIANATCSDPTNVCCNDALGYDLSLLTTLTSDLHIETFDPQLQNYYARPCGEATDGCPSSDPGGPALCRVSGGSTTVTEIARWPTMSTVHYEFIDSPDGGLQMWWQSEPSTLSYAPTLVTTFWRCNASIPIAELYDAAWYQPDTYEFTFYSSLVCGPGSRSTPRPTPASTLTDCITYPGTGYDAQLCPRSSSSEGYYPLNQTNPIEVIERYSAYDAYPFTLMTYEESKREYYSRDGAVFFSHYGVRDTTPLIDTDWYGQAMSAMPMVAGFYSNGFGREFVYGNHYYTGIFYSREAEGTNHKIVLRYSNFQWYGQSQYNDRRISFDIVMHEAYPGDIEVHFYQVSASGSALVTIGMQGKDLSDQTRVLTAAPLNQTFANQLQGATMRFRRLPPKESTCSVYGIDFSSIFTTDIVFTNTTTSATWFVNPCKQLTFATSPCPPYASVCRESSNDYVAIIYPTTQLITWSPLPSFSGVRSMSTAGHFDESNQCSRSMIVDWICKRGVRARIVSIHEGCVTNMTIEADAVCAASALCASLDVDQYPNQLVCAGPASHATLTTPVSILQGVDDGAVEVNLPFSVGAGGLNVSTVWISSNGALSFGSRGFTSVSLSDIDDTSSLVIAAMMTDLIVPSGGSIQYSTEMNNNEPVFTVRYDVAYAVDPTQSVKFDIKLSQVDSNRGKLEIVYWQVPLINNLRYSVGFIPSNNQSNAVMYANSSLLTNNASLLLSQGVITIIFDSTVIANIGSCMALDYDLSILATRDLAYRYFDEELWAPARYIVRMCGAVTEPVCVTDPISTGSSICLTSYVGGAQTSQNVQRKLGVWNNTEVAYQYPTGSNGVMVSLQTGSADRYSGYPAYVRLNYVCDVAAKRAYISGRDSAVNYDNHVLDIHTILVCQDYVGRQQPQPTSTLTECVSFPGKGYTARLCPRNASSAGYNPVELNLQSPGSNLFTPTMQPVLYEQSRSPLMEQFGIIFTRFAPPGMLIDSPMSYGVTTNGLIAFFPVFHTQFTSWSASGWNLLPSSGYGVVGTSPNRQFIFRWRNQRYTHEQYLNNRVLSFDVVFNEAAPYDVEFRYYSIHHSSGNAVTIGAQGDASHDTTTRILTVAALNETFASQLQGSTLTFTYVPPTASNCMQYGVDFSTLFTSDVEFADASNSRWFINPCKEISSPTAACHSQALHASVCREIDGGGTTMAYSMALPSSRFPTWDRMLDDFGIVSTFSNGAAYCTGSSKYQTRFLWMCNHTATTAYVSSVQSSSCINTVTIQTNATCQLTTFCGPLDYSMAFMTKRICPSAPRTLLQIAPVQALQGAYNAATRVPLPFALGAGGRNYESVWISSYGALSFGSVPFKSSSFADINSSTTSLVIAGLLCNLTMTNAVTYSTELINNITTFVVHFDGAHASDSTKRVVFDTSLSVDEDGNGLVEIFYHRVDYAANVIVSVGVYDVSSPPPVVIPGMPPMPIFPGMPGYGLLTSDLYAQRTTLSSLSSKLLSPGSITVALKWNGTVTEPDFPPPPPESSTGGFSDSSSTGVDSSSVDEPSSSSSSMETSSGESLSSTGIQSSSPESSSSVDAPSSSSSSVETSSEGSSSSSETQSSSSAEFSSSSSSVDSSTGGDSSSVDEFSSSSYAVDSSSFISPSLATTSGFGDSSSVTDSSSITSTGSVSSITIDSSSSSVPYQTSSPDQESGSGSDGSSSSLNVQSSSPSSSAAAVGSSSSTFADLSSSVVESSSQSSSTVAVGSSSSTFADLSSSVVESSSQSSSAVAVGSSSSTVADLASSVVTSTSPPSSSASASESSTSGLSSSINSTLDTSSSSLASGSISSSTSSNILSSSAVASSSSSLVNGNSSLESSTNVASSSGVPVLTTSSSSQLSSTPTLSSSASQMSSTSTLSSSASLDFNSSLSSSVANLSSSSSGINDQDPYQIEDETVAASMGGGAIAGLVIGVIAGVTLCIVVAVVVYGARKRAVTASASSSGEIVAPVVADLEKGEVVAPVVADLEKVAF